MALGNMEGRSMMAVSQACQGYGIMEVAVVHATRYSLLSLLFHNPYFLRIHSMKPSSQSNVIDLLFIWGKKILCQLFFTSDCLFIKYK